MSPVTYSTQRSRTTDDAKYQWRAGIDAVALVAAGATVQPRILPTTGFNRHDNAVMPAPRVFAIYWGRDWGSPATGMNASAVNMDAFLTAIMSSNYLDWLAPYGSRHGTFLGSTWLDHSPTVPQTLKPSEVASVLIGWLTTGLSPTVPGTDETSLLFLVFTPSEVTLAPGDGVNGEFCAYHSWGMYHKPSGDANLFFAVTDTTSDASVVSHEMVEAFSDRDGRGWYSDDTGSEIADTCNLCSGPRLQFAGFPVASFWLVQEDRCLQQTDLAAPGAVTVPDVLDMRAQEAVRTLEVVPLTAHLTEMADRTCNSIGVVMRQEPRAGTRVGRDSVVTAWVGSRPPHPCP